MTMAVAPPGYGAPSHWVVRALPSECAEDLDAEGREVAGSVVRTSDIAACSVPGDAIELTGPIVNYAGV